MGQDTKVFQSPSQQTGIRLGNGLILLNLLSVILIVVIMFLHIGLLRMILVVPYLLFVPGYALLAVIFVKEKEISGVERLVLSVVLSFVIEVLIGLFLNYIVWGIRLEPALYFISGFVFLTSVIAWFRWARVSESKRFTVVLNLAWMNWEKSAGGRMLSIVLAAGILASFGFLGYLLSTPRAEETFSEFYILGQPGKTIGYPQNLKVGEDGRVYVGIVNHENKEVKYSIRVLTDNNEIAFLEPALLSDGQNWEGEVSFNTTSPGADKRFDFLLYRDGEGTAYKSLHLWINITE